MKLTETEIKEIIHGVKLLSYTTSKRLDAYDRFMLLQKLEAQLLEQTNENGSLPQNVNPSRKGGKTDTP